MSKSTGTQAGAPDVHQAPAGAQQAFAPKEGLQADKAISDVLALIANGVITAGAPFCLGCYEIPGNASGNNGEQPAVRSDPE